MKPQKGAAWGHSMDGEIQRTMITEPYPMKRCNTCGRELPDTEFYHSTMTIDGLRGECRTCTRRYERERKSRVKSDPRYVRHICVVPNRRGNDSYLVAIPPAAYHALGGPHAIQWTIRGDTVEMEAVG